LLSPAFVLAAAGTVSDEQQDVAHNLRRGEGQLFFDRILSRKAQAVKQKFLW